MKQIEHLLLPPVVVLLVLSFFTGGSSIDFHLHDTYFVVANVALVKWLLFYLLAVLLMYTVLRRRRGEVHRVWALTHILVTLVLPLLIWLSAEMNSRRLLDTVSLDGGFDKWQLYSNLSDAALLAFLLSQLVFIGYFLTCLFRTPQHS